MYLGRAAYRQKICRRQTTEDVTNGRSPSRSLATSVNHHISPKDLLGCRVWLLVVEEKLGKDGLWLSQSHEFSNIHAVKRGQEHVGDE